MVDKTLSEMANPLFFDSAIVNGLFRWTDAGAAVKNAVVILKADGPPIDVGAPTGANTDVIGVVLEGGSATNEQVVVLTKFSGIVAMTAGGTVARGDMVKTDATGRVVVLVAADAELGVTIGMVLQGGAINDILYVGITS